MKSALEIVDLGCKHGQSLDWAVRNFTILLPGSRPPRVDRCLGVDLRSDVGPAVKAKGYRFQGENVLGGFEWPAAKMYVAFHFLEHLPSVEIAAGVLRRMLDAAREAVIVRLPNFEADYKGELGLRLAGLRFTWTHWTGHPAHVRIGDVLSVMKERRAWSVSGLGAVAYISSTADPRIVPIECDQDVTRYDASTMPPKGRTVAIDPPLASEWQFVMRRI